MSGSTPGVLPGEETAGTPESGGYLVENQQYAVAVAQIAQAPQILGTVEPHAAGTLHDGLEDKCGKLARVLGKQPLDRLDVGGVEGVAVKA